MHFESTKKVYQLLSSCSTELQLHDNLNQIVSTIVESTVNGKDGFVISVNTFNKFKLFYAPKDNYFGILEKTFGAVDNFYEINVPGAWLQSYFPKTMKNA